MEFGIVATAILAIAGALLHAAHKSKRKWATVYSVSDAVLSNVLAYWGLTGLGLLLALGFPEQVKKIFLFSAGGFAITLALLGLLRFANWLREPDD